MSSLRYLLDTNVVSEALLPHPNEQALLWLESNVELAAIASLTLHELCFGVFKLPRGARRARLAAYIEDVVRPTYKVLGYDENAAQWHAEERAKLVLTGRTPAFVDGQIAAIAHVHGLCVVTANQKDFRPFRNLTLMAWPAKR